MRNAMAVAAIAAVGLVGYLYFRERAKLGDKPAGGVMAKLLDLGQVGSPDRAARSNQGWRETYYPTEGELDAAARTERNAGDAVGWSAL